MKKILNIICTLIVLVISTSCNNQSNSVSTSQLNTQEAVSTIFSHEDNEEIKLMYIYINSNKLEVTLEDNSSVEALIEILKQNDIIYNANDYGDFEKVGDIGYTLPQNDTYITTQAGDVILNFAHYYVRDKEVLK